MSSRGCQAGRGLIRWAVLLSYSLLILATLSLVRTARDWLGTRLGERGFDAAVWGLLVLAALAVCRWAARQHTLRSWRRVVVLAVACGLYVWVLARLDVTVERIHYLEYGLVAVLAVRAFEHRGADWSAYVLGCLYVMALGLVDESIQWVLPTRVGEFRDVTINLSAGLLGLIPVVAARERPFPPTTRVGVARMLRWGGGVVIATALFLTFVHGFGYAHRSSPHAVFRSVFPPGAFDEVGRSPEAVSYQEFPDSPISHPGDGVAGWVAQRLLQWRLLRHPTPQAYNYEAWRHRQLRDAFEQPRYGRYREAAEEERILATYFGAYHERFDLAWAEGYRQYFEDYPLARGQRYVSAAQELLITWARPGVFWAVSGTLAVLLLAGASVIQRGTRTVGTAEPSEEPGRVSSGEHGRRAQ